MNTHWPSYLKELLCQILVAWLWFKKGPVDRSRALLQHLPGLVKGESGPGASFHHGIILAAPGSCLVFLGADLRGRTGQKLEVAAAFRGLEGSMCRNGVVALWNVSGLAVRHGSPESHHAQWVAVTYGYSTGFGGLIQGIIGAPESERIGPRCLPHALGFSPVFTLTPAGWPTAVVSRSRGAGGSSSRAPIQVSFDCRVFQRVRLGKQLLHRVHQVTYAPRALAALLGHAPSVKLQRAEAVALQRQVPLDLIQKVRGQTVDLGCGRRRDGGRTAGDHGSASQAQTQAHTQRQGAGKRSQPAALRNASNASHAGQGAVARLSLRGEVQTRERAAVGHLAGGQQAVRGQGGGTGGSARV